MRGRKPNHLPQPIETMLKRYKGMKGLDDDALASIFKQNRSTVNIKMNKGDMEWKLGELFTYCAVLGVDKDELLKVLGDVVEVVYGTTNKLYRH